MSAQRGDSQAVSQAGGTAGCSACEGPAGGGAGPGPEGAPAFSEEGRRRRMAGLRSLVTKFSGRSSGVIGLHGGLPPQSAFPFTEISVRLQDGTTLTVDDPVKVATAQQYPLTLKGYGPLYDWCYEHTMRLHRPPGSHEVTVTTGNNPSIEMVLRLLCNKGDAVVLEEFTYPALSESVCAALGYRLLTVAVDRDGIVPAALRKLLAGLRGAGQPLPKVLYTVPVGQNPTGSIVSLERRREVYALCREYGLYLLEDDPYFYLQLRHPSQPPLGLQGLGSSYLSLDTDGRVIRLDTFSKMLAPGLRLGWVTAHPAIIEKCVQHLQGISVGACMLSQVVTAELLQHWGPAGFEAHVRGIQGDYSRRALATHEAALQHLAGLAEWEPPRAGMFLWLRLLGVRDAGDVLEQLVAEGVVVVPGRFTYGRGPDAVEACPYVRLSFSSASPEDLREGVRRLGAVLRAHSAAAVPAPGSPLQNGSRRSTRASSKELHASVSDFNLAAAFQGSGQEHGTQAKADALASGARSGAKASLMPCAS